MDMTLRKVLKNHRALPTDESALKVVYLAIQNISQKWTMPICDRRPALTRFAIAYEEKFPT
jgi:putative transposase